jgi:hypothetical protein
MTSDRRKKAFDVRTTRLLGEFLRWWVVGPDESITIKQARQYTPHLYAAEHADVGKQKLDAWVRRGWVWLVKDEERTKGPDSWADLVIKVHLTEEGRALIEALEKD